jgi:hypothetical protein
MGRPHIESIQAQLMPWITTDKSHVRPGVEIRTFSEDDETGASSSMIRYPAGWSQSDPAVVLAQEEIFVLDGEIEIAGETYRLHDYANLPVGYPRDSIKSEKGAVVLTFFSETPKVVAASDHTDGYDEAVLIKKIDTVAMRWERSELQEGGEENPMAYYDGGLKFLRQDPHTKEQTFLFAASPQTHPPEWKALQETHAVVEESFVVMGEMIGPREVRSAGAYFWRPPHILHGPFGSLTGVTSFIRTVGGSLVDIWNEPKMGFAFKPEPRPQLPPEMEPYSTAHWNRQTNY